MSLCLLFGTKARPSYKGQATANFPEHAPASTPSNSFSLLQRPPPAKNWNSGGCQRLSRRPSGVSFYVLKLLLSPDSGTCISSLPFTTNERLSHKFTVAYMSIGTEKRVSEAPSRGSSEGNNV
ncbi:hypothetical protein TRVL_00648 [Trypanosoma vivax]|uniref:Uncharacterized protein n=1 Tax=Trypanosoma vivax (strain Y486) TaxID=1055687 RepID=G0U232_TRYVY|nr:hypothetical protein TRVL_00648 [Trypanosoma vivax]CCC50335.1 hypothetical protein TVY486_0901580 [Trypanosoma vivax Y486]